VSGPPADTIASFEDWPFDLHDVPLVQVSPKQLELVVEPVVTVALDEVVAVPSLQGISVGDLVHGDAPVQHPLDRAAPSPMEELLKELEAPPSHFERRSCRLDLKHKGSDIPASKRAEFRRAKAFGEVPNVKSKGKASEEVIDEKMQHFLKMYKKQHTPKVVEAVRALVQANA
jgi:hypothetical protein